MICPICRKGELINFGLLTCCYCRKMWQEHEFLTDVLSAGLSYYFEGDINGECVIYNPQTETHDLIESIDCPAPKAKEKESMRIEEAIEILDRHYTLHHNVTREELDTAARLGIEALKSIHGMRQAIGFDHYTPLPGETEEARQKETVKCPHFGCLKEACAVCRQLAQQGGRE